LDKSRYEGESGRHSPQHQHPENVKLVTAYPVHDTAFNRKGFFFFLLVILIAGTTRGVVGNYLPLYLEKAMNLSSSQIGLLLQARIITEIGIFFLGKQILVIFGVNWMLFLAQASGFLRVFAYAFLPTSYPWTLMPVAVELLKGVNNACLIAGGTRYVCDSAPAGYEATAQGLFSGVHSYLANSASGFFGGLILHLYRNYDEPIALRHLFSITSGVAVLGMLIHVLSLIIFNRRRK
jgi:hypothetical protein